MAIQTIKATIQMRNGREEDFDPDQMVAGEWAVSTDERYIRMCVAPGVCVRIALYNAFEGDMEEIIKILEECRTIQEAVERIQAEIGQEVEVITTLSENAKNAANTASQKASEAAGSADSASTSAAEAMQKADSAQTSANAADASKAQAQNYAQAAQENAQAAQENAQAALQSANTAGTKAGEAVASANAASGHADRAETGANNALDCVLEAESYAHGDTGIREGENKDNALYYKEQARNEADRAKSEADRASNIVGIGIATADKAGIVKPDGETITVDPDGTLHSQGATEGTIDYNELQNQPSVNGVKLEGNKTLLELGIQPKGNYAPVNNPAFTGTPTAPTPPDDTNSTQIATTAFVKAAINALINGAPETLDTLKEIADALAVNETIVASLDAAIGKKVDKVPGKGLSANDFTSSYKNKLDGISSGAEVNVQADWGVTDANSDAFIKNKPTIPSVGNGAITIKQAGVSKGTFTTNQSGNTTIELTDNNTTYADATTSAHGLMTAADKTKLNGIATNANKTTYTNNLTATVAGTALDAVQGKVLDDKGKQMSVYKGTDGNLHFRNWAGADSVIPFSKKYVIKTVPLQKMQNKETTIYPDEGYKFESFYLLRGIYDGKTSANMAAHWLWIKDFSTVNFYWGTLTVHRVELLEDGYCSGVYAKTSNNNDANITLIGLEVPI